MARRYVRDKNGRFASKGSSSVASSNIGRSGTSNPRGTIAKGGNKKNVHGQTGSQARYAARVLGQGKGTKVAAPKPAKPRRRSVNQGVRGESKATKMDRAVRIAESKMRKSFGKPSFEKNMRRYSRAMEVQTRNFGARLSGI